MIDGISEPWVTLTFTFAVTVWVWVWISITIARLPARVEARSLGGGLATPTTVQTEIGQGRERGQIKSEATERTGSRLGGVLICVVVLVVSFLFSGGAGAETSE